MEDNDFKLYNKIPKRKTGKSKSQTINLTFMNLKWILKLRRRAKVKVDKPIYIKKELEAEEMIENAKIHRQANRPLKQIKEFDGLTKFCQCCYNPMKDQIHVTNFNFCDSTDEYAEFGMGISLYFFYLKYAIAILSFSFFLFTLPNVIISLKISDSIIDICQLLFSQEVENISMSFPTCNRFVDMEKGYNQRQILFKYLLDYKGINILSNIIFKILNH